jgi:glycogen debranching enzyme
VRRAYPPDKLARLAVASNDEIPGAISHPPCRPQAWSTRTPLLLLRTMLGDEPVSDNRLHISALRPLEVCCHPGRGWFTSHHKPDNQLLINSEAVYRPSFVENSRVTMSSVEQ